MENHDIFIIIYYHDFPLFELFDLLICVFIASFPGTYIFRQII